MLEAIREKLTGWVAFTLLGLIALTLVVSFGNIDTGFSPGQTAASVNGEDIPQSEFRRVYDRQRLQWEQAYRAQIPPELADDIADLSIQNLVRSQVIAQHVKGQRYRADDTDIIGAIESNPAFEVGGQFSRPAYREMLRSQGFSEQRYEFELRQSMEIDQFVEGIAGSAFYTPSEFRRYIELDGETRSIEYLVLSVDSQRDQVQISDEQVAEHYTANPARYQTEEAVTLEYVEIDFNQILAATEIDEAEVRDYFDSNPTEFAGPEERNVRHILLTFGDDEAAAAGLANELYERLQAGESFETLAAEYSADSGTASSGGDLGWLGVGDSPAPEFDDALFAMGPGDISEPVRSEYGFHLIRLDAVRAGANRGYAEVRDELLADLRENAAQDAFVERLDELDDRALESLDGLAPVAEAMELQLNKVEEFTQSGGLPLGFSAQLVDTVFSLEVLEDGENSPVVDLGDGRSVVVSVVEHRLPELQPLEAVSDGIRAQLEADEAVVLAATAGAALVGELSAGADPESLAAASGLEWQRATELRRGSDELEADMVAAVFGTAKPAADVPPEYHGLMLGAGDYAVFRVLAVAPGRAELYAVQERDARKEQLAGQLGSMQTSALVENLVSDASITVAEDLLGTGAGAINP